MKDERNWKNRYEVADKMSATNSQSEPTKIDKWELFFIFLFLVAIFSLIILM